MRNQEEERKKQLRKQTIMTRRDKAKTGSNWLTKQNISTKKKNPAKREEEEMKRIRKQRHFKGLVGRVEKLLNRREKNVKDKKLRGNDE